MHYIALAWSFIKVGLLSFGGGGYAMIPLIQREVEQFGISGKEFIDILAISQVTPGPIGINASTYTGFRVTGFWGSVVATLSCAVPPFLLMLFAVRLFYKLRNNRQVENFFKCLRPVFIGLIATSVAVMIKDIQLWSDYKGMAIFLAVFIAGYRFKFNPIFLILLAGIVGFFLY